MKGNLSPLPERLLTQISEYANLRDWFAFKDQVVHSNLSRDLKASIIDYGLSLMMNRYHHVLP